MDVVGGLLVVLVLGGIVVLPVWAVARLRRSAAAMDTTPPDLRRADDGREVKEREIGLGDVWPLD